MSNTVKREIVIAIGCMAFGFCLTYFTLPQHGVKVYDCSIAEISPDYPIDVKNECRKQRLEKIK